VTNPEQIRTNLTVAMAELAAVRGQLSSALETAHTALGRVQTAFEGSTQREYASTLECLMHGHDEILMAGDDLGGSIEGIERLLSRL
jgi:uncharacterized protein YukE